MKQSASQLVSSLSENIRSGFYFFAKVIPEVRSRFVSILLLLHLGMFLVQDMERGIVMCVAAISIHTRTMFGGQSEVNQSKKQETVVSSSFLDVCVRKIIRYGIA